MMMGNGDAGQKPNYDGLILIGAGLPRTGTTSMRSALSTLLKGQIYHMDIIVTGGPEESEFWFKALRGEATNEDWVEFLENRGFRAGLDNPFALFYKDIMEAFPNAKVVLTTRDPVKWYHSIKNTFLRNRKYNYQQTIPYLFSSLVGQRAFLDISEATSTYVLKGNKHSIYSAVEAGEATTVEYFNKYVEDVKAHVPKEKLLVFDVKQGWKPLCNFLNVPEPETPFPNMNDTAAINWMVDKFWYLSYFYLVTMPIILAILAILAYFMYTVY